MRFIIRTVYIHTVLEKYFNVEGTKPQSICLPQSEKFSLHPTHEDLLKNGSNGFGYSMLNKVSRSVLLFFLEISSMKKVSFAEASASFKYHKLYFLKTKIYG